MRRSALVTLILSAGAAAGLQAQEARDDQQPPALGFLEYLGSWQETDEEWLVVSEWEPDEDRDRERDEDDEDGQADATQID